MATSTAPDPSGTLCLSEEMPFIMSLPPELATKLDEWERQSTSVRILVTGKTGTGKSTLVNKLVGKKVAAEGKTLDPNTAEVTEYHISPVDGITVTVWDSPGLQDGTTNERKYLKDIEKKCNPRNIDLFIYCIRMSERRFVPGSDNKDLNAMKKLTSKLGKQLWNHAIIVLTFANDIVRQSKYHCTTEEEMQKYFIQSLDDWRTTIISRLYGDIRLPEDVVKQIKVIPADMNPKRQLPYPEGSQWLSHLWIQAVLAMKSRARPAMIKINQHRFANCAEEISTQKDLVFEEKAIELIKKCRQSSMTYPDWFVKLFGVCKSQGKTHILLLYQLYFHFEIGESDFIIVHARPWTIEKDVDKKLIDTPSK